MDSQEDSASAVLPGLLVSLVDVYEHDSVNGALDIPSL